jgi:hypothetical protein
MALPLVSQSETRLQLRRVLCSHCSLYNFSTVNEYYLPVIRVTRYFQNFPRFFRSLLQNKVALDFFTVYFSRSQEPLMKRQTRQLKRDYTAMCLLSRLHRRDLLLLRCDSKKDREHLLKRLHSLSS